MDSLRERTAVRSAGTGRRDDHGYYSSRVGTSRYVPSEWPDGSCSGIAHTATGCWSPADETSAAPMMLAVIPAPPSLTSLPVGFRVCLDRRVRFWSKGAMLVGGAPWRIARIDPRARTFVDRLRVSGLEGSVAIKRARAFDCPIAD